MALNEIQLPSKDDFYQVVRSVAGEMKSRMIRWKEISEFIAEMDAADMDAMGVPAGTLRTKLVEFRTALDAQIAYFESNTQSIMDEFRKIAII